jgi:thioredoxin 1
MVAPAVDEIAKEYKERLKVCKLNVDEAPRICTEYGIMSIPTLAIFKSGKIMDRVVGVVKKEELKSKISPHLK